MFPIANISAYKFTPLKDLKPLRSRLTYKCKDAKLKGSILLSQEGINLFVAGNAEQINSLLESLRKVPGLEDLSPKISLSTYQPFTRMLVKIKKEIIAFGVDSIKPSEYTSPRLPARELKKWLDEGRDVLLLDTRNDYEVKLGTFRNARMIGIQHFRDFPKAVDTLSDLSKDKTLVTFCTGGIRCEKAAPFLEKNGFKNVFQLDGGILKYFEECGNAHYDGGCFVFDQRVGVDPSLLESKDKQCFLCLSPLTPEDQADPRYVAGRSCPYCFESPEEKRKQSIIKREGLIQQITSPLPGKTPYDNYRPLKVPKQYDGFTIFEFIADIFPHISSNHWEGEFDKHHFLTSLKQPVSKSHRIKSGERYLHLSPCNSEPDVNVGIKILYEDEALVVIDKPAPLPVHPCGRYNRNTLQWILNEVYHPGILRPLYRLDANTTGVLVFARSKHFAKMLQQQITEGQVEKIYRARCLGHPLEESFLCETPILDQPIEVGARTTGKDGLPAKTQFRVLKRLQDGTALLEIRPRTGRTNQIRIHLWSLGIPCVGDSTYLLGGKIGAKQTKEPWDEGLKLLCYQVLLSHPVSHQKMLFTTRQNKDL